MSEINRAVKGTNDILPSESYKYRFVEEKMLDIASLYGFKEIRVPVFEHTEVFSRNVGDSTDVVQKEMYTFLDKGGRSITLRPELTAGVVRSVIEKGVLNEALPAKVCYIGGCYRYEKPQAGRLREFHQFGVECFGAKEPSADAEIIALARQILITLGVKNTILKVNSIGCEHCRKNYVEALKSYFEGYKDTLCATCNERLVRNPLRILDCKSPVCSKIAEGAPQILDFLCDDCKAHFNSVKENLSAQGIPFVVDPQIVRGLDYYNRTVFEFVSDNLGAQSTVCGGGRYDGLVSKMGGNDITALGFGLGIERLMIILNEIGADMPEDKKCTLYVAAVGDKAQIEAGRICAKLRIDGIEALCDLCGRGLKAQMKYADKIGAKYTVVLGEDELNSGKVSVKDMKTGETYDSNISDITDKITDIECKTALKSLEDSILGGEEH
ncbi:MAG: histidine--tRNA ligase [Clostridia bacterium]|nr:histidine--tRNA ligase [Clostridia bacterium]